MFATWNPFHLARTNQLQYIYKLNAILKSNISLEPVITFGNILVFNGDIVISVGSFMLMVESDRMHQFMN